MSAIGVRIISSYLGEYESGVSGKRTRGCILYTHGYKHPRSVSAFSVCDLWSPIWGRVFTDILIYIPKLILYHIILLLFTVFVSALVTYFAPTGLVFDFAGRIPALPI
jgi:hypothetical protein